jgi:hypothetical protein
MDDVRRYFEETKVAIVRLFEVLLEYRQDKMRGLVKVANTKSRDEFEQARTHFNSKDLAREIVAGAILQVAYMAIKQFSENDIKPDEIVKFESRVRELIRTDDRVRCRKFSYQSRYCIGRHIGAIPIGLVIFAGRNQYNHFDSRRLSPENEVVFDHLNSYVPESSGREYSFNLRNPDRTLYSYSVLSILGWVDNSERSGFDAYQADMEEMLGTGA